MSSGTAKFGIDMDLPDLVKHRPQLALSFCTPQPAGSYTAQLGGEISVRINVSSKQVHRKHRVDTVHRRLQHFWMRGLWRSLCRWQAVAGCGSSRQIIVSSMNRVHVGSGYT